MSTRRAKTEAVFESPIEFGGHSGAIELSLAERASPAQYKNALEPQSLIAAFLRHPPEGFQTHELGAERIPAFSAPFYALTTLDGSQKWLSEAAQRLGLEQMLTVSALFVGTTVSEYMVCPPLFEIDEVFKKLKRKMGRLQAELIVIKDLPLNSPLLTRQENFLAQKLVDHARANYDYFVLSGQALAYVKINFNTIEEYLLAMSKSRRKDMRRKLKAKASIAISELRTGDRFFFNPHVQRALYRLYLNVYEQSKIHFDKLSIDFLRELLVDSANNGIVFIYKDHGRIIGFNLCFVHNGNLVDKYIGLEYPAAREKNLYFLSWFHNLEYAVKHKLQFYIAGWTDPEVKSALGAKFTFTQHAVFIANPLIRAAIKNFQHLFESDQNWAEKLTC